MKFVTLDMETFYSQEYTLKKMSLEDYVSDPRFEIILVGIKINDEAPYWVTGTKAQIAQHLHELDLPHCVVLAHNVIFDALILAVHFGIYAARYCDSMMLAQAQLKPFLRSVSLDSCLKHLDLGIHKGTAVHNMIGRSRQSLSRAELQAYAQYCMDDCEGEFRLFRYLAPQVPREELDIMDMTARMFLVPQLELDSGLLAQQLAEVKAKKLQSLNSLPTDVQKADLMSNVKFAEVLRRFGVDPPTKISPTTGNLTFAFNRTDTAWKELEEEWADDTTVAALLAARISAKSTLEESRTQRLLDISVKRALFRVPLRYYAAHTGRYGGMDGINVQNFPRVDKSRMRYALKAPKGYVVLAADLAQIEARITAWLARQENLLEGFRRQEDIYSTFATTAFNKETVKDRSPEDKFRRFVGKTCILGLGFGMSDQRLRATLRKDGVKVSTEECLRWVNTYRMTYSHIPFLWRRFDQALGVIATGAGKSRVGPLTIAKNAIVLPNGMAVVYNSLRRIVTEKYTGYVYNFAGETRTLWGGKVTENVVQALARILVMDYALEIKRRLGLQLAMQAHDELVYVLPSQYAEKAALAIAKLMRVPPSWAPDLPVEVEVNYGPTYGACK